MIPNVVLCLVYLTKEKGWSPRIHDQSPIIIVMQWNSDTINEMTVYT